jgi:spermidine synthase
MFKKLLSYIFPIIIFKQISSISQTLEVTLTNGKLVLDSEHTNYSYGNLQRILRKGLKKIGFKKINSMSHILILGVAGGSVIRTLVDEIHYEGQITGVDIDKNVIEIAKEYFQLDEIQNLEIIIDDAFEFVLKTKDRYDLILIDVFQDTKMPGFLFQPFFIERICFLLNSKGFILFNTMVLNEKQRQINLEYIRAFDATKYNSTIYNTFGKTNEVLLIESKN